MAEEQHTGPGSLELVKLKDVPCGAKVRLHVGGVATACRINEVGVVRTGVNNHPVALTKADREEARWEVLSDNQN